MKTKIFNSAILTLSILFSTHVLASSTPVEDQAAASASEVSKVEKIVLTPEDIQMLSKKFTEDDYYKVLDSKHSQSPEITEYFSTFCSHCRAFESILADVLKRLPEDLTFNKKHISWMGQQLGPLMTKAVVTAQQLGIADKVIPEIFALNFDKQAYLYTDNDIRDFFIAHNVSEQDFDNTYNNVITLAMAQDNDQSFMDLGLTGVPSVIINNKYLVQPPGKISEDEYQKLVAYLLTK